MYERALHGVGLRCYAECGHRMLCDETLRAPDSERWLQGTEDAALVGDEQDTATPLPSDHVHRTVFAEE